jgi:hypothetical protein
VLCASRSSARRSSAASPRSRCVWARAEARDGGTELSDDARRPAHRARARGGHARSRAHGRAVDFLQRWWKELTPDGHAPKDLSMLEPLLELSWDEAALTRFALEARLVEQLVPQRRRRGSRAARAHRRARRRHARREPRARRCTCRCRLREDARATMSEAEAHDPVALRSSRLRERIDALALSPERAGSFTARVLRPLLRWVGYAPRFETEALTALLDDGEEGRIDARSSRTPTWSSRRTRPGRTHRRSTARGTRGLARARARHARPHPQARRAADRSRRRSQATIARSSCCRSCSRTRSPSEEARSRASSPAWQCGATSRATAAARPTSKPQSRRLLELQLAAIDRVMDAARDEVDNLERRRRLLEGARRLLLDASAALPTDERGSRRAREAIARGIITVDRAEAAGLSARVGLAHQAKLALRRGDRERLHAALLALDGFARGRGDDLRLPLLDGALERMARGSIQPTRGCTASEASRSSSARGWSRR